GDWGERRRRGERGGGGARGVGRRRARESSAVHASRRQRQDGAETGGRGIRHPGRAGRRHRRAAIRGPGRRRQDRREDSRRRARRGGSGRIAGVAEEICLATVRIYRVAELLNTTSQEVTALLKRDHGIEVKSASSTIEEVVARQFVERLAKQRNITLPTGDIFAETPPVKGKTA